MDGLSTGIEVYVQNASIDARIVKTLSSLIWLQIFEQIMNLAVEPVLKLYDRQYGDERKS